MSRDDSSKVSSIRFKLQTESEVRTVEYTDEEENHRFPLNPYERSVTSTEDEEENKIDSTLLEPDHPLLEKFQIALKNHLIRQVNHLKNEVFELETGAKKKAQEREELGIETYNAQQLVNKQQDDLEHCVIELQDVCAATEEMENELDCELTNLGAKRMELLEAEKNELHLRNEIEGFNLLVEKMSKWEHNVESDLIVSQKAFEKMNKEKERLGDEQQKTDMIIYKLMTENWKLEEELQTLDMQLRVKEEERERLAEAVSVSNVDMETLNVEYRCLLNSWNSIIVAISQRDKHFSVVKNELDSLNEKVLLMNKEMEQTKKLCKKEMIQNERLTDLKGQIAADMENCKRVTELEIKKRNYLEKQMQKTQSMIDQIEKDIHTTQAENANKNTELLCITAHFEKLCRKKFTLEDKILMKLEEQMTNNKAAHYLNKLVRDVKEKNRNLEITLAKLENQNAKVLMDIAAMKCINGETQRFLDDLTQQSEATENQVKEYNKELEAQRFESHKKERDITVLDIKINRAIEKQGGIDVSPQELKILNLRTYIEETQEKIKQLQKFWLRQQGHVVGLSKQRQEQLYDMNFIKKQLMLLVQKNLKLNDELDLCKKIEDKMGRSINFLLNRLEGLNEDLCKKKGYKENVSRSNDSVQNEYMGKLKDAELEVLKFDAEVADIDEDKVGLSKELIEVNREALVWEKKIQMTVEARKSLEKERGEGGEVGNMKSEIHRMNVRLGQLKKAQDKLLHDLEHCISRRDAMLTLTEAREKRFKGQVDKTRINFNRKLDDMRNKVKQLENEVEATDKKIQFALQEEQKLNEEINLSRKEHEKTKAVFHDMLADVEETKTLRQKNLESLLIKQKKLKVYAELSKGRLPYMLYKSESSINLESGKQKEINAKLSVIVENLMSDFPSHFHTLQRIYNTLSLPIKLL